MVSLKDRLKMVDRKELRARVKAVSNGTVVLTPGMLYGWIARGEVPASLLGAVERALSEIGRDIAGGADGQ